MDAAAVLLIFIGITAFLFYHIGRAEEREKWRADLIERGIAYWHPQTRDVHVARRPRTQAGEET